MPYNPTIAKIANLVAESLDADVIQFNGPIQRPTDQHFISDCNTLRKRKNVLLFLITTGGDPDAAYRIARCLQTTYERFYLYVPGFCKSAGTLVALGAHELIMSDHGELGPLDVQMSKKDEIWDTQSGLTVLQTLTALHENAYVAFQSFFEKTVDEFGEAINLRTAQKIATELTTGLFAHLYNQIDPIYFSEAYRAMSIAGDYGFSLLAKGQNIEESGLGLILSDYPSHGYVIDREEASTLFRTVREPTPLEIRLEEMLGESARWEVDKQQDEQPFRFLSPDRSTGENGNNQEHQEESNHAKPSEEEAGPGCGNANETAHEQSTERGERAPVSELDTARGTRGKRRGAK